MIRLRQYPKMATPSFQFGIPVSCIHKIIHKMMKYLHVYLVPKYMKWHSMREWTALSGFFPEWPRVVALLDCTPFRINKPKGIYIILFLLHIILNAFIFLHSVINYFIFCL